MGVRERVREREFERERVCSENRESLSPSKHFKTSRPLLSYSVEYFSKLNDSKDLRLIDYSSRTRRFRNSFENILPLITPHNHSHNHSHLTTLSLYGENENEYTIYSCLLTYVMILKRWVEIFEINFVFILRDERRVSARRRFF